MLVHYQYELPHKVLFRKDDDHYAFLGNCPPTPPQANINTSLRAKLWLRGGVRWVVSQKRIALRLYGFSCRENGKCCFD